MVCQVAPISLQTYNGRGTSPPAKQQRRLQEVHLASVARRRTAGALAAQVAGGRVHTVDDVGDFDAPSGDVDRSQSAAAVRRRRRAAEAGRPAGVRGPRAHAVESPAGLDVHRRSLQPARPTASAQRSRRRRRSPASVQRGASRQDTARRRRLARTRVRGRRRSSFAA